MSPDFAKKRATGIALVKKYHGALKPRSDGPPWHHLDRVSKLLEIVLEETSEGTAEDRETIALAALGHDALEDTSIKADELSAVFGPRGLSLIQGMTNPHADDDPVDDYVAQVTGSEEGVRLIKLADLYDNCTSVTYTIGSLGVKWAEEFFLPITAPMITALMTTEFSTYAKAGERLKSMVRAGYTFLIEAVARQKSG